MVSENERNERDHGSIDMCWIERDAKPLSDRGGKCAG